MELTTYWKDGIAELREEHLGWFIDEVESAVERSEPFFYAR